MQQKAQLRKKFFKVRKRKYYDVNKNFFLPLTKLIKLHFKNKNFKLALYYPSNFEVNVLKALEIKLISKQNIFLPVIEQNNQMNFFPWKKNQILFVNKFGLLEPNKTNPKIPDMMLIPILSYDHQRYRLGYGRGFYDRYLNKYLKKYRNIFTVGVAFSFQKHHKLPKDNNDVKLNYILTEKGIY
tara:strand:- start:871 stop:1422 length:552 start_codon:yes stop_codon:yes gene_type:complete